MTTREEEIAARHKPGGKWEPRVCLEDSKDWPCDAAYLLTKLREREEALTQLRVGMGAQLRIKDETLDSHTAIGTALADRNAALEAEIERLREAAAT